MGSFFTAIHSFFTLPRLPSNKFTSINVFPVIFCFCSGLQDETCKTTEACISVVP